MTTHEGPTPMGEMIEQMTRRGGAIGPAAAATLLAAAQSQEDRGRALMAKHPDVAARIVGAAFDAVVLVDGAARTKARQDMLRIARLARQMAPHLACD